MLNSLIVLRKFLLRSVIKKTVKKSKSKYGKKFSISMKKQFDSELVYGDNDKYISTKIKSYGDKINTNFQDKKIPKENSS